MNYTSMNNTNGIQRKRVENKDFRRDFWKLFIKLVILSMLIYLIS